MVDKDLPSELNEPADTTQSSTDVPSISEPTTNAAIHSEASAEHLSDAAVVEPAAKRRLPSRKVLLMAAGAMIAAGLVAVVVFNALQPTSIERAYASCSGTQPLDNLLSESDSDAPGEDSAETSSDNAALEKYFEGVLSVEDDGTTLIVATLPEDDDPLGVSSLAIGCIEEELEVPKWLQESISSTRALDGRQSEEWDNLSAQWGYHPDSGLNLIIVQH